MSAASGLVREFRKHAVPLTRSPSMSAVVMAMIVLGGMCVSLLGKKMRSAVSVGGAAPSGQHPPFSPCISAQESQLGLEVSG